MNEHAASSPGSLAARHAGLRNGIALAAVVLLAILLLDRSQIQGMAGVLRDLPACLAVSAGVHLPQLLLTALAWWALLDPATRPSPGVMTLLRWLRESAGTLLPGGGVLGQVAAARQLVRRGVPADLAGATATVDVTVEAVSQLVFTLAGLGLLLQHGIDGGTTRVAVMGIAIACFAAIGLVGVQRLPRHSWLATRLCRLALILPPRWQRGIGGIHRAILSLHNDPKRLVAAIAWHAIAWALGAVEVVGVLGLLGTHVTLADGVIVESMAQALRNAGFMLPGALGVQEGAIIGAAALVGIPAGPALTLALVRRTREVLMALPGPLVWQRIEAANGLVPAPTINAPAGADD